MPLNFPDNPQQNDTFTVNGRTYTYRGNRWRRTKARLADVSPTLDVANDFTAGGALHVDSGTGRVGIGTANPQYELHVDGVGEVTGDFQVGQNLDVTGTVDINGLRLTSDGSSISLSEVLAGTYSTQAATTNDDTLATTAFVQSAIANLVDSAPGTLNTLNELAAALDDDPNFATTVTNSIALKLDSSSYTAADVLAKLLTVDGSGSSLDADTLDGSHASAFTSSDSFQWRGVPTIPTANDTTSELMTYLLGADVFDSSVSAFKTSWSYAGNANLTDAGGLTELAGTSWLTWTDNSTNNVQGNMTALVIAPNTGGSAGGVFIYNDQGSSYSPGWREVWTSATDGSGSGLDADLLDGNHASAFATSSHSHSYVPTSGGTVTGNFTAQGNLYVGKNGGGDSIIYFYDDNSNAWREFFWDDSENRFRTSHNMKLSGYLHAGTEMYVGDNGGGDSWVHFYDDNSNTWRTFGWDDSDNEFYMEGGLRLTAPLDMTVSGSYIQFNDTSAVAFQWGAGGDIRWNPTYNYIQVYQGSSQRMVWSCNDGYNYAQRFYQPGGGSTYNWSDERLKRDVTDYSGGLAVLRQLRPVEYNWDCETIDDGTKREIGLIAQEVQEVYPNWVGDYSREPHIRTSDGATIEDVLALGFGNDFNVMVISALKELAERIEALEAN